MSGRNWQRWRRGRAPRVLGSEDRQGAPLRLQRGQKLAMFPLLASWAGVLRASQFSPSSPSKSSHHFDDTREVCLLDSRSGVLRHPTHARLCACHRSMTAAFIIRDAICRAFGAVRNGIPLQMTCVWGPRSCDAQKGPQKSPLRESLSGNRNGCLWTTQSHFLRRFSGIYGNFFNITNRFVKPSNHKQNFGPI